MTVSLKNRSKRLRKEKHIEGRWILAESDSKFVVEALLNPRAPSTRMKAALHRYRQRVAA